MRLVFMGTPTFVVPVLEGLIAAEDVQVVGVYTPPDRPRGRGRSPEMPPVKARALDLGLSVYQPDSLRSQQVQVELAECDQRNCHALKHHLCAEEHDDEVASDQKPDDAQYKQHPAGQQEVCERQIIDAVTHA